ncbi:hypothetical protein HXX76_004120 [Chlamydomonas incerta]|uniref:Uncharacterized protein n=1 Tax=Chlamydomonas incerta TaxID=51695 RepID=A0A835T778_CHLIN|nr:hypothetical protein HXX76_004120 [Chlamydomonas incerta]|eukprot:KAG2440003.1 hypothetical protein HXX76_004120 [Chlamydomonas incerta]
MSPLPGGAGMGAAAGGEPGVDAAVLAAAKQRAERLREALDEERQRGAELEQALQLQVEETSRALEKAERRKQRLAAMEHEHKLVAARLESDRSRLEERVKWLEDEAAARAKSLQALRGEVAKLRSDLGDKDQQVMRARREAANCRARLGAAPPTAVELMELAGDDKVSWAQVYSITVEERNRALDEARRLQEAVAKGRLEMATRAAAERLAGEERVKERDAELDRRRREIMQLEYKLNELQAQLADAQRQGSASQSLTPVPTQPAAGLAAPPQQHQPQPRPQGARAQPAAFPPAAVPRGPQHLAALHAGKPQLARGSSSAAAGWQQPRQQAAGTSAAAFAAAEQPAPGLGAGRSGLVGNAEEQAELLLAHMGAREVRAQAGGGAGAGGSGAAGASDDDDEGLATLADFCGEEDVDEPEEEEEEEEEEEQPEQDAAEEAPGPGHGCGGAGPAGVGPLARVDWEGGGEEDAVLIDDDCGDPVPALPRAVCGLFAGGGAGGGGGGGARASGGRAAVTAAGTATATGRATAVPSFAKQAAGASSFGSSRLIGEAPDGRGGTTRFPLTSSFAVNQVLSKPSGTKGGKGGGKGSGAGAAGRQGVGAAGRIDAFLKRVPVVPAGPGPR